VSEEFIGSGWAFPLRLDVGGEIALSSGEDEIEESIELILSTAYGERPMRPEFGCGIHDYIFSPIDATTAGQIAYEVRASLLRWEPRIEVLDVIVTPEPGRPEKVFIDIRYTLSDTNDARNLVFPFYTIPSEE
jgi:uncharacterized protein